MDQTPAKFEPPLSEQLACFSYSASLGAGIVIGAFALLVGIASETLRASDNEWVIWWIGTPAVLVAFCAFLLGWKPGR